MSETLDVTQLVSGDNRSSGHGRVKGQCASDSVELPATEVLCEEFECYVVLSCYIVHLHIVLQNVQRPVFTSRRYASAVYAMAPCPSVCIRLSQVGVLSKRLKKSSWFLARGASFNLPNTVFKKIRVSPKIKVLPSGTLPRTLDLENIATASQSCCQQNSSTVELIDHTYDGRDASLLGAHSLLHVGRL